MALKVEMVQRIDLGIQGEHKVRPIRIDCTSWLDQFPNGSIDLMHQRNGDEAMNLTGAVFDRESKTLTWLPTEYDTYYGGEGFAEIRLTEGRTVKKKKKALTVVRPAIVNEVGDELESNLQAFVDEVTRQKSMMGSESEAWAVGKRYGVDVDEQDETYHNNSKYFASNIAAVKDQYIQEIHEAGEEVEEVVQALQDLIPEDWDYYAPAAEVREITSKFTNGILGIPYGGTGASTVAGARNALGLGNTDGAVPIANGGTGATTAAGARNALGLGNTDGALPVANGGTGATTPAGALAAIGGKLEIEYLGAYYNWNSTPSLFNIPNWANYLGFFFIQSYAANCHINEFYPSAHIAITEAGVNDIRMPYVDTNGNDQYVQICQYDSNNFQILSTGAVGGRNLGVYGLIQR